MRVYFGSATRIRRSLSGQVNPRPVEPSPRVRSWSRRGATDGLQVRTGMRKSVSSLHHDKSEDDEDDEDASDGAEDGDEEEEEDATDGCGEDDAGGGGFKSKELGGGGEGVEGAYSFESSDS